MKNLQNNNKNIWILNHYTVTPDMSGGTRHYDFSKELIKRGYNVTIFASSFHHGLHTELKLDKNKDYKIENIDGINFIWIKTFPYQKNNWRRVLNMVSYMWRSYWVGRKVVSIDKSTKKPDVVIGSSVHLLAALATYWLSKYYKAKFIMEVRDLWPQSLIDIGKIGKNSPTAIILRLLEKFLYKKSCKIITLSPLTKDYLELLDINKEKIYLIPNGVDLPKYKFVSSFDGNKKGFKIMYTGSMGVVNALNPALQAIKIIREKGIEDIKLVFIGNGIERNVLIKEAKKLKIKGIEFLPSVSKSEMPFVLGKADIFLLMENKIFYGSSNKLMDYMAAGKPIVFSTFAGHNNVQKADCGISVSPKNPEKMAEAIIKLYKMTPEKREEIGRKGREHVEKYHSIPVLIDKLEEVIKEVVNEQKNSKNN